MSPQEVFVGLFFTANVLFCLAYVVRDMVYLRAITIVAALCTFPYFYFQDSPLYSAIFWQFAFVIINGYNLTILMLRMRPVSLRSREQKFHKLVFFSMQPRDMLMLLNVGTWRELPVGAKIVSQGESVNCLSLLYEGHTAVLADGKTVATLGEGDFVGEMSFISGAPNSADVVCKTPVKYLSWDRHQLNAFYDKRPEIRDVMQAAVGRNMAEKLRRANISESEYDQQGERRESIHTQ